MAVRDIILKDAMILFIFYIATASESPQFNKHINVGYKFSLVKFHRKGKLSWALICFEELLAQDFFGTIW
jgi:hypothetical protein